MHVCSARVELNLPSRTLKEKRHTFNEQNL
jgi:hypothetical protein